MKSLVKINFDGEKGYIYSATNEGMTYVSRANDSYSLQYQSNVRIIQQSIYPIKISKLKEIAAQRRDE